MVRDACGIRSCDSCINARLFKINVLILGHYNGATGESYYMGESHLCGEKAQDGLKGVTRIGCL